MGDPRGAHKEPEFRGEEPEARYCLLIYGQSSECLRPQRPQSNLRLSEDAGSVLVLYFLLKGTGRAEQHLCLIFESVGVGVAALFTLYSFCTCRQRLHHAGGGSQAHSEGAGKCDHSPSHTNCHFIYCCQVAVDGKGTAAVHTVINIPTVGPF